MQTTLVLWQILSVPWLIPWLFAFNLFSLPGLGNTILYPHQGPSIWCTKFKWQDEINGAMVVTEGQKLYFKLMAMSSACDCGKNPGCNRLENAFCEYSFEAECGACRPCNIYSQTTIPFYPRNSGHPKLLRLDGVANQVTEPIDIASCKVAYGGVPGSFSGFCWYSNSQAGLQPFYTYILTSGGPIMESIVWTTLMAGAVSVSITTADWMSMNNTFQVGEKAMLKVTQRDSYGNPVSSSTVLNVDCFKFTGFVSSDFKAKVAIASQVVKYECDKSGDGTGYIYWYPTTAGKFWLQVGSGGTNIRGSPFPFEVTPGPISIKTCTARWHNSVNTFMAGNTSTLQVLQKDIRADGVQLISFMPTQAGEFFMHVGNFQEQISGSPFPFKVLPGQVNVSSCTGAWKYTQEFGAGDEAQFLVTQRDSYGNVVGLENGRSDIIDFNTSIVKVEGDTASIKIAASVDFVTGIQTIHFNPTLAGSFKLIIGKGLQSIYDSPFGFIVNTGPISVAACKAQWLNNNNQFNAGATGTLIIIVTDKYGNEFNTSFPFIISVHKNSGLKASNIVMEVNRGSDESYTTVDLTVKEAGSYYLTVGTKKEFISNSPIPFSVLAASLSISNCVAVWDDGTNIFNAGSTAMLRILQMDAFGNNVSHVTGVFNQSSNYITKVIDSSTNEETTIKVSQVAKPFVGYHYIRLDPKVSGNFLLYVGNGRQSLSGSPFSFEVIPGPLSLSKSYAFWERNVSEFKAGVMASLNLWTKDAFNNVINATSQKNMKNEFLTQVTSASSPANDLAQDLNIIIEPDETRGCWLISFQPKLLGEFFLQVGTENGNVSNSPLLFTVDSGLLSLRHSSGGWLDDINEFQPPGIARFYLILKDSVGNILNETNTSINNISVQVYDSSGVPLQIPDMQINYVQNVSQYIISFTMNQIGQFAMAIGKGVDYLAGSPFQFYYIAGDVDPAKTVIVGNGLNNSTAGELSTFSVQLRDNHGNPTGASNTSIAISILRFGDPLELPKNITSNSTMIGFYNVSFIAKVAGQYAITIRWRGVTLNSGPAFYKTVVPGPLYLPNTIAFGSGLERGVAGDYSEFTVLFRDALNNSNPKGQADVLMLFSPNTLASYDIFRTNTTARMKYRITNAPLTPYYITILAVISNTTNPIPGSPFQIYIESGTVSTLNSVGGWLDDRNTFEVTSMAEFIITPRDVFGNEVSRNNTRLCNCNFSAQVYKIGNAAPIIVRDMLIVTLMNFTAVKQKLTFSLQEIGDYLLQVGNVSLNILGSPFTFSYVTGLPDRERSIFTGNGLNNSYAGDFSSFLIKARDKAGNPVVADISLLNVTLHSKNLPALIVNTSLVQGYPGTFVITYMTTIAASYTMLVRLMSVLLYEGHKSVFAGPILFSKCKAIGSGLQGGYAGQALSFVIVPYDEYNNVNLEGNVTISLSFTPNVTSAVQVSRNDSGIFIFRYCIFLAQTYSLNIVGRTPTTELSIPGSPFEITVIAGGIRPQTCAAEVLSPVSSAGEKVKVLIKVYDANGDYFVPHVKLSFALNLKPRLSDKSYNYLLEDNGNGTFIAAYEIYVSGAYVLLISLFGTLIDNNPYPLTILPGPIDVASCVAYGEGLLKAVADTPQNISIEARDRFQNLAMEDVNQSRTDSSFYMRISGESIDTTFQFIWASNGRYKGTYVLSQKGYYELAIQNQGRDIYGSPFYVTVISAPCRQFS